MNISKCVAALMLIVGGAAAAAEEAAAGDRFRDCAECPLMTVVPGDGGALAAYAVGVHAVTFRDWAACAATGDYCQSNPIPGEVAWSRTERPAVFVSRDDVTGPNGFLDWINSMVDGAAYRLPTADEFEHAARAGGEIRFWSEDETDTWREGPLIVGGAANPSGLHNLRGAAWEWVRERRPVPEDGDDGGGDVGGGETRSGTVMRASEWTQDPLGILPPRRAEVPRDARSGAVGFRVARSLEDP